MRVNTNSFWLIFFVISAAAELGAIIFGLTPVHLVAKPLLMITLLLYFIFATKGYPAWRTLVGIALVCSWAGDVFLMVGNRFVEGLSAFLLAHLFYISAYHKTGASNGQLKPQDMLKFVLFGIVLIWMLYPGLDDMLIPVVAYALILLSMGVWAHKRRGATSTTSFRLVAAGAVLFVVSDGLLALNRFAIEIPAERILVMSTYIAAQFMIVQGLIKHEKPGYSV